MTSKERVPSARSRTRRAARPTPWSRGVHSGEDCSNSEAVARKDRNSCADQLRPTASRCQRIHPGSPRGPTGSARGAGRKRWPQGPGDEFSVDGVTNLPAPLSRFLAERSQYPGFKYKVIQDDVRGWVIRWKEYTHRGTVRGYGQFYERPYAWIYD